LAQTEEGKRRIGQREKKEKRRVNSHDELTIVENSLNIGRRRLRGLRKTDRGELDTENVSSES